MRLDVNLGYSQVSRSNGRERLGEMRYAFILNGIRFSVHARTRVGRPRRQHRRIAYVKDKSLTTAYIKTTPAEASKVLQANCGWIRAARRRSMGPCSLSLELDWSGTRTAQRCSFSFKIGSASNWFGDCTNERIIAQPAMPTRLEGSQSSYSTGGYQRRQ